MSNADRSQGSHLDNWEGVHVWIGITNRKEADLISYFSEADEYWSVEDPSEAADDVTGCGFSIDLGERYLYDDDLLSWEFSQELLSVRDMIEGWPLCEAAEEAILRACAARAITHCNALFLYFDPDQKVRDPLKLYCGLPYLGLFDNR